MRTSQAARHRECISLIRGQSQGKIRMWDVLGNVGSFFSAIFALAAIVYAVRQIRETKRASREANALQSHREFLSLCFQNPKYSSSLVFARNTKRTTFANITEDLELDTECYLWFVSILLNNCEQVLDSVRNDGAWRLVLSDQLRIHYPALDVLWPDWGDGYSKRLNRLWKEVKAIGPEADWEAYVRSKQPTSFSRSPSARPSGLTFCRISEEPERSSKGRKKSGDLVIMVNHPDGQVRKMAKDNDSRVWLWRYFVILGPCFLMFVIPTMLLEQLYPRFTFPVVPAEPTAITSKWIAFVLALSVFEIVGIYCVVSGILLRNRLLDTGSRYLAYVADLVVLFLYWVVIRIGGHIPGSEIVGYNVMIEALRDLELQISAWKIVGALNVIETVMAISAVVFITFIISNFALIAKNTSFEDTGDRAVIRINHYTSLYYDNLYATCGLLTAGIVLTSTWLSLPHDSVVGRDEFGGIVTSLVAYRAVLFSFLAFYSAITASRYLNRAVAHAARTDLEFSREHSIKMLDSTVIITSLIPAAAGFLFKFVPSLI